MKQGSIYVGIVVAALSGYFIYQTWFNPTRLVKRRLGEIAGVLSMRDIVRCWTDDGAICEVPESAAFGATA